jgi:glyoxylate utilization-related uncharacterized protein
MSSNFHDWDKLEWATIIPGYRAKFVHSDNMSFALWDIDAGAPLPEHSHPHEQVTHLLEGEFEITLNGNTKVMQAGYIVTIPSNSNIPAKRLRIAESWMRFTQYEKIISKIMFEQFYKTPINLPDCIISINSPIRFEVSPRWCTIPT